MWPLLDWSNMGGVGTSPQWETYIVTPLKGKLSALKGPHTDSYVQLVNLGMHLRRSNIWEG